MITFVGTTTEYPANEIHDIHPIVFLLCVCLVLLKTDYMNLICGVYFVVAPVFVYGGSHNFVGPLLYLPLNDYHLHLNEIVPLKIWVIYSMLGFKIKVL